MGKPTELLQGTLDLLILKTLALEPMHGWGITLRIQQITGEVLQVRPGALYPALHRLEHQGWIVAKWGETAAGRRAKYYSLTRAGPSAARSRIRAVAPAVVGGDGAPRYRLIDHDRSPLPSRSDGGSFVLRRRAVDRELDEELRFQPIRCRSSRSARGDGPSDARWQARRHMGSVHGIKEACRDMRTLRPLEHFLQDLRFGVRLLVRGRGFATVAVVSLALGIGASSSIFSVINAIVLRPLPVADPHELHIAQVDRAA